MLKYGILAAQVVVAFAGIFFLWQFWRKFKSIPEDEIIGEERTTYMHRRLIWFSVCVGVEVVLQIANFILRTLEVI